MLLPPRTRAFDSAPRLLCYRDWGGLRTRRCSAFSTAGADGALVWGCSGTPVSLLTSAPTCRGQQLAVSPTLNPLLPNPKEGTVPSRWGSPKAPSLCSPFGSDREDHFCLLRSKSVSYRKKTDHSRRWGVSPAPVSNPTPKFSTPDAPPRHPSAPPDADSSRVSAPP